MTMDVVKTKKGEEQEDYAIKPQAVTPAIDTSSWPLLLKNYEKRECCQDGDGIPRLSIARTQAIKLRRNTDVL